MLKQQNGRQNKIQIENFEKNGVDVFDGPESKKVDTNPFTNISGSSSANPFNCYLETVGDEGDARGGDAVAEEKYFEEGSLMKGNFNNFNCFFISLRLYLWLQLRLNLIWQH